MAITNPVDVQAFTTQYIIPRAVQIHWNSNAALWRAHKKRRRFDGGTQIEAPLFYGDVTATGWYQDRGPIAVTNDQMAVNAVYQLREAFAHVSVSGRDMARNSGAQAVKSFWKMKLQYVKDALADLMGTAFQGSNGTGIEFDGLGLALSTSSTYGNLAVADVPDWVAQVAAAGANTMTLLNLQQRLGACTRGASRATLMLGNQSCYDKFTTFGDTVQRIVDTDMASVGIAQLNFRGVPFVVDSHVPGSGAGVTDNEVQFLNEEYLELWIHRDYDFKVVNHTPLPGEDVTRQTILVKGNVIQHARHLSGKLTSINPSL